MDRPLDDVIAEKQGPRPRRPARNDDYPRDGVRKSFRRDAPSGLDAAEWVHDRYDEDPTSRRPREPRDRRADRPLPDSDRLTESSAKIRVENLHYDLTDTDLRELFLRIGPITSAQILYDRSDRSRGIAYVVYESTRDANRAVREYDGANAFGQPIKLTLVPSGPAGGRGPRPGLDERVGSRSLFDRIEEPRNGGRRTRSESPVDRSRLRRSDVSGPPPENVDRYVPSGGARRRSRSPLPSRRGGRPPGAGRGERRGGRGRGEGRAAGQPRPRKTATELDAEMADYWGSGAVDGGNAGDAQNGQLSANGNGGGVTSGSHETASEPFKAALADDDVDMIE